MVVLKVKKERESGWNLHPWKGAMKEEMILHTRNLLPLLGVSWDRQGASRPIGEWSSWPVAGGAGRDQHRRSLSHCCTSHAAQEPYLLVCATAGCWNSDLSGQTWREDSVWLFRDSLRGLDCGLACNWRCAQYIAWVHRRSPNVNKHRKGGAWPSLSNHIPPCLQRAWLHH